MVPGAVGTLYSRINDGDCVAEDMLPDVCIHRTFGKFIPYRSADRDGAFVSPQT